MEKAFRICTVALLYEDDNAGNAAAALMARLAPKAKVLSFAPPTTLYMLLQYAYMSVFS